MENIQTDRQSLTREELLQQGEDLCLRFSDYLKYFFDECLQDDELVTPKLRQLTYASIKVSTNRDVNGWLALPQDWGGCLKNTRNSGSMESLAAFVYQESEYFKKLFTVFESAKTEVEKFFHEPDILEEANELIQEQGIPLLAEIIEWFGSVPAS